MKLPVERPNGGSPIVNVVANGENQEEVTFEEFCEEWLSEFTEGGLPPFEKSQQFAFKMVPHRLGVAINDEEFVKTLVPSARAW